MYAVEKGEQKLKKSQKKLNIICLMHLKIHKNISKQIIYKQIIYKFQVCLRI